VSATFYVGAYWGARREDVEPCARRLQDFLEDLGCNIGIWNGGEPDSAGLSVHCGGYTAVPGILNNCVIHLPGMSAESEALYEVGVARSLMAAVVECWEPDWATWTSHELREALPFQTGEVIVGWMTYLSSSLLRRESRLPALPNVEEVGDGVLITLGDDAAAVSADDVLALRRSLGGAVASEDV